VFEEIVVIITRTIQAITKDTSLQAYIRLLTAAAPSDSVFFVRWENRLNYLLSYRLVSSLTDTQLTQMPEAFT